MRFIYVLLILGAAASFAADNSGDENSGIWESEPFSMRFNTDRVKTETIMQIEISQEVGDHDQCKNARAVIFHFLNPVTKELLNWDTMHYYIFDNEVGPKTLHFINLGQSRCESIMASINVGDEMTVNDGLIYANQSDGVTSYVPDTVVLKRLEQKQ